jgi:AraC-like DNA-binding protein
LKSREIGMDLDSALGSRKVANIVPTVVRALLGFIEEHGAAPERICRGLGFTYQNLLDQEMLLSYVQIRELILRCQRAVDSPALGLAVGSRETPVSWGVAGLAMLTCETFGHAMSYGLAHQSESGAMMDHYVEESGREIHINVHPRHFDLQIERFLVEEALASAIAIARYLLGPAFKPLRVDFAQPRPDEEEPYRRFFKCHIRFSAGCNRVTLDSHWLGARLPGYDRITCGLVQAQLASLLEARTPRDDLVDSVSNRMRFEITSQPKQTFFAETVNLSERTLRRRLAREQTTFRKLRDNSRFERARDLLANSNLTVAQVAEHVGYSDARAFRRAFKRWTGILPADFRSGGER